MTHLDRSDAPDSRWFRRWQPSPAATGRLFCLHYAGGGASMFRPWARLLPPAVDLVCVQLPGREDRSLEEPYSDMGPLVERLAAVIEPRLGDRYALFGSSMGARVGLALTQYLRAAGAPLPRRLFVAASPGPSLGLPVRGWNEPDDGLIGYLRDLGGTPARVLGSPDLLNLVLPVVRADLTVVATWPPPTGEPVPVPIHAFAGAADPIAGPDLMRAWARETTADFALSVLPGDHFFLASAMAPVARAVAADLGWTVTTPRSTGPGRTASHG